MFRCCSLETSHPRLLPQSPKACSVHLCLFFCFAYRVICEVFSCINCSAKEESTHSNFSGKSFLVPILYSTVSVPSRFPDSSARHPHLLAQRGASATSYDPWGHLIPHLYQSLPGMGMILLQDLHQTCYSTSSPCV